MTDNWPVSIDTKYRIEWTQSKHCSTRHVKSCSQIWSYFESHNNCQWIENQWDSKHQSKQCFRHFDKTEEYFHHALCLECFKSYSSFMTTILENWFKDTTWEIIQIDVYCSCCCNYSIIHHLCSNMSPSVYHPGRIRRDHGARELENKQTWLLDLVETNPWLQFTRKCGVWPVLTNNIITDHSSDTGLWPGWRDVCFPATPIITNYHQSKKRWINHYFNESFSGVMFLVFTPVWWWCYEHTNVGQMNHIKIEIH